MRKLFVTVTLLVMLAVSCENGSVAEKAEYTEDGQRLVTVKVNTGGTTGNRSLTNDLAKEKADYMEVIFKSRDKHYRAAGSVKLPLSITIPVDTYTTADAIMLIGRKSDTTLLATGVLATDTPVTAASTVPQTIVFTVTILTADISATGAAFVIEDGASSALKDTAFKEITKEGVFGSFPCFQVPSSFPTPSTGTGISASLTIAGFGNSGAMLKVDSNAVVKFTGSPDIQADVSVTAPLATASSVNGVISFTFKTSTEGEYIITFDVPVKGLNTSIPKQETWHIRGGTSPNAAFSETDGEEGVMLVVVDDPGQQQVGVVVKPNTW